MTPRVREPPGGLAGAPRPCERVEECSGKTGKDLRQVVLRVVVVFRHQSEKRHRPFQLHPHRAPVRGWIGVDGLLDVAVAVWRPPTARLSIPPDLTPQNSRRFISLNSFFVSESCSGAR